MATTACDIRRSPIDASVSWRVMDPEYYTIGGFAQLPGLYGFRVQDRVKSGTMSIVYNTTGGSSFVQVTGAPVAAGQFFLDETTGLVICNALDVGQSIVANYQGGGTVFSLAQITSIATAAGATVQMPDGYLYGFFLSNSGGDPTNDIDITSGVAKDSTNAKTIRGSAITKRLDAPWAVGTNQGGLDTGSIADTTYHVWIILRSDTGVVDALFSTSASSPTMPASYDYKVLVGSIIREGGSIVAFTQIGNWFQRSIPRQAVSANNPGTSGVLRDMYVPTGIKVKVKARWIFSFTGSGTAVRAVVTSPDETDAAPSTTATPGANASQFGGDAGRNFNHAVELETFTNTSGQVRTRVDYSDANLDIYGVTVGWYHPRGQW